MMMIAAPKQCKLLGATVHGLGLVVAVSSTLTFAYAIVAGADKTNRRVALTELRRDEVTFPAEAQPYRTRTERVDLGVWDEVHSLLPIAAEHPPIMALIAPEDDLTSRAAA